MFNSQFIVIFLYSPSFVNFKYKEYICKYLINFFKSNVNISSVFFIDFLNKKNYILIEDFVVLEIGTFQVICKYLTNELFKFMLVSS